MIDIFQRGYYHTPYDIYPWLCILYGGTEVLNYKSNLLISRTSMQERAKRFTTMYSTVLRTVHISFLPPI